MSSIYIHIPFCKRKCYYCDFLSISASEEFMSRYISALKKEIEIAGKTSNDKIDTLFIGGGTPSYIDAKYISEILGAVKDNFYCELSEATIECNPDSITDEKMRIYKNAGINRISIGVQSLDDNILRVLGRVHNSEQAIDGIKCAKSYFNNVSADVMLGVPHQTMMDVNYTIDTLCDLDLTHISAYGLKVEPGTMFYEMQENGMLEINEDYTADIYENVLERLKTRGYERYEISNFARDGFESKHNLAYWTRVPYLGLGAGAYSFWDNKRFNNTCELHHYVDSVEEGIIPRENIEEVSKKDAMTETIMLNLRTKYGMDIEKFNREFSVDFLEDKKVEIEKNKNYIDIANNIITIKDNYYYISNSILSDLIY